MAETNLAPLPMFQAVAASAGSEAPASDPSEGTQAGLLALGLAGLCAFLNVYASQPLLPTLEHALNASKAEAALTVSAPSAAVALTSPIFGLLAERFGQRRVMVASIFALVLPTALAATAPSVHWLVFWRFCQGLSVPGIYAVGIAYAARRFARSELSHAMASLVTGNVIGGFLGRTLSGQIAAVASWRYAFLTLSLLTLVGAALTARLLPQEPASLASPLELRQSRPSARRLVAPAVLATYWVGFSLLFIQVAMFTYVTFYLADAPFHLGPSALGSVFAIYLIGALVTPRAGRIIDHIGTRRGLFLAVGLGLLGALITLLPSLPAVVLGLACCATATFVGQSAATSHLSLLVPEPLRARASGLYLSCYYIGGAVGGVAPALAWHAGGWNACVLLVVVAQVLTLLCIGASSGGAPRSRIAQSMR
jgi:MFS transporter, YNFM family, putative membrane transport protein